MHQPPSLGHLLGTNEVGYDVLGRLMVGGQVTLVVGVTVALLGTSIGLIWGSSSRLLRGLRRYDPHAHRRRCNGHPHIVLAPLSLKHPHTHRVAAILVIAAVSWPVPARLVRAETLSLRTRQFVEASKGMGAGPVHIMARHIVPNVLGTVVVTLTFQVADAVLALTALSFLGLGIPPPATDWGSMLAHGVDYVYNGYWWQIWPAGLAVVALVVSFNFIGDGLRDAVDVRLRTR